MSLVYVTGLSGSGKSAVCKELQRRGYDAHDTDLDGNAAWVDRKTGEVVAKAAAAGERTADWLEHYGWQVLPARVEELSNRAKGRLAFLCGLTENENQVWHLFSETIYLAIDEATLRERLATRTSNDFGKSDHELAAVLKWHKVGPEQYRTFGATIIDATQPLADVVDDVLTTAMSGG